MKEQIEELVSKHTLNLGKCITLSGYARAENKFTNKLLEVINNTPCRTELNADDINRHFIKGYRQGYNDAMEDNKK